MNYQFEDFLQIIEKLRSENGCPWDREQTHESLRPCMIEEAYELVSSVRILKETGSHENMREELGDVLLQVVLHSQIAKDEGLFTIEDVIQEVSEKMVRRHPHVFGQVQADTSGEVLRNWEEIKHREKVGKEWVPTPLREIPEELPSLIRGGKVYKKIAKLYGDQSTGSESLMKIENLLADYRNTDNKESEVLQSEVLQSKVVQSEVPESEILEIQFQECQSGFSQKETEDLLGDILLELTKLAAFRKINLEQILADRIEELIKEHGE